MELKIGRRLRQSVASVEDASRIYQRVRDRSMEGRSTFPEGWVVEGPKKLFRITYNGRVWTPEDWPNATLVSEAAR